MTITLSSSDFEAAMKGAVVAAYSDPTEASGTDFVLGAQRILSPAEVARNYWRWDTMPQTMHRLA